MAAAFIHGFILAIGLILPLGVQNFFIFSQGAVNARYIHVLPIVITAGICDSALILLAVLGVSVAIMSFFWMKTVLVIAGAIFLVYMGIVTWRSKPAQQSPNEAKRIPFGKVISFTVMISLLNPHAILDTVGLIGTSSLSYQGSEKTAFTAACILVSWLWFFALSFAGRLIGMKDKSGKFVAYLNKVSAVVMLAAAVYLVISLLKETGQI